MTASTRVFCTLEITLATLTKVGLKLIYMEKVCKRPTRTRKPANLVSNQINLYFNERIWISSPIAMQRLKHRLQRVFAANLQRLFHQSVEIVNVPHPLVGHAPHDVLKALKHHHEELNDGVVAADQFSQRVVHALGQLVYQLLQLHHCVLT